SPADIGCIGFSLRNLELLQPAPPRKRLWQGAIALLVVVLTFTIGNALVPRNRAVTREILGQDFLAFYTAGTLAREGRFDQLYDLDATRQRERAIASENAIEFGDATIAPFWNPPFYAWPFAAISTLPFRAALLTWTCVNLIALAGAIVLLIRMLPAPPEWRTWLLVPLLILTSM